MINLPPAQAEQVAEPEPDAYELAPQTEQLVEDWEEEKVPGEQLVQELDSKIALYLPASLCENEEG